MKVQRRHAIDILVRDGETAILLGRTAVRLSELGATIYALTEDSVEVDVLARELEARFGAPQGSSSGAATEQAVEELVRRGVLTETRS